MMFLFVHERIQEVVTILWHKINTTNNSQCNATNHYQCNFKTNATSATSFFKINNTTEYLKYC